MRLPSEFIRLPMTFDAVRLAEEIGRFDESDWRPHPQGYPGNSALSFVAIDGDPSNDSVKGTMRPTRHLQSCPYVREVLESLGAPIGRTRLMRIDGNAEATPHSDMNYYWLQRMRVHVPIVTDPAVTFLCGDQSVHMAAGEAWVFDTWKVHNVLNPNPTRRIHLVCDTAGSPYLRALMMGQIDPATRAPSALAFEDRTVPVVMSPDEQAALVRLLAVPDAGLEREIARFQEAWREVWQAHGERRTGWPGYRTLLERFDESLSRFAHVVLDNGLAAPEPVRHALVHPALHPEFADRGPAIARQRIERPIFIVSSPRSGSTLFFETLAQSPTVFTPGGESHAIIEGIDPLHPARREWESNRLTESDATPMIASVLETRFLAELRARDGSRRLPPRLRMLEKTPKNALRIPFLRAVFPDAHFIYLYRDPRATLSSMIEAWRSGKFVTYPQLPGWEGLPWSMALVAGWRGLIGKPLEEIVAHQWSEVTRTILDDLNALPADAWSIASYDELIAEPQMLMERLSAVAGIAWDRQLTAPLPLSKTTVSAPDPDKWKRNGDLVERIAGRAEPLAARARELFARMPPQRVRVVAPPLPPRSENAAAPFRSVHTNTFPAILKEIRGSLAVSTYQSGRVVIVRADGDVANTHFLPFESPMGLAVNGNRLAIATAEGVWDYRQTPAVTARLEPAGKHDACFIPRNKHVTGDIRVHEVAFDAEGTLWVVNTRFSTLCTLDADHSFVPRWRPPFITDLAPEDRCHLNGLAMVDGRPRLVTVLGETDKPAGWRANKAAGGALLDVETGHVIVRGLSMPHSPRWYAGRIWLLESGKGTLIYVDTKGGKVETVAQLPGFARGLAFSGHYAFIGLSQVRESVFDGIPLSQRIRLEDRSCGVWVVDIRSGNIVAFLKFEDAVQEIFDVQVVHGTVYPELLDAKSELVRSHFEVPAGALAAAPK